ncbi:uncharacterized protein LOC116294542 [Actinia tenebrosa]|uniref:Uncharacterized protein LOC116294542 n=1 Tax=Actinia tenebrosa TaxID=6105 RepID=A0A6P8HZJ0_ACTTE|nr:uncharacterized protein LOC116294542 [Actinia tenebrosa]
MALSWRSNLKSPRKQTSLSPAQTKLTSPREQLSANLSPRQDLKMVSPRDEKNIVKSRWSHLSASPPKSKSPRKEISLSQVKNKPRITADELIARKFSAEKKPVTPRQRSQVFLKAVQKFEGEIPGKLLKTEEARRNLADEQLEFCSNELVDMREFLEQIEMDFSVIRQRIEKAKEDVSDLRRSNRAFVETG